MTLHHFEAIVKSTDLARILHAAKSSIFGNHTGAESVDGCMHHAHPNPHHHPTEDLMGPQDWVDGHVLWRNLYHDSSNLAGLLRYGRRYL